MDKLYLGPEDDRDVDDLLAQINDEGILKMSVNTHKGTDSMRTSFLQDEELSPSKEVIDPDLEARYASLKAPRPTAKDKETTVWRLKQGETKNNDLSASPKQPGTGMLKVDSRGSIARSSSAGSESGDSLDAELNARLQALKGPSVSEQGQDRESTSKSGTLSSSVSDAPTLSEHLQALRSRSKKSPQMSPSHTDYPVSVVISSTAVGSSGWCAPTSPFKLIKALNINKGATDNSAPPTRSPSKPHSSQPKDAKKAVKKSLSHASKEDDQVDPAAMVADVQRLLAAVSKQGRSERGHSTGRDPTLAGDKRTFNMKDRNAELLKAMEDEEAIALEAEKVVEWAKDNARLEGNDADSGDDLEVVDSDESDDPAGADLKKKINLAEDSDPEEVNAKSKKRKGRRRWNFL